jgi:hypothetical protein
VPVGRRLFISCFFLLAACDWPRRAVPREVSAPPLPPGSIIVDPSALTRDAEPGVSAPPTLAEEAAGDATNFELEGRTRIDLRAERASGTVTITTNDPAVDPKIETMLDGSVHSLVRGEGINPLVITFIFARPIALRTARVVLAGSTYDWTLEAPVGDRRTVNEIPERVWSQIDLPEAVKTTGVRIEALRLERDDFVHVNEIELWVESGSN